MAYGRLDVFWPDGRYESYSLEGDSVSIGRSTGNTITLDTETISRYHLSITDEDGDVYLTDLDSANGTFVDGLRLASNEKRLLDGVEEILIGHLRLVFHPVDDSPTLPITSLTEDTQRVIREAPDFRMDVQGPDIAISPGAYSNAQLAITNTSDKERKYSVEITGMPEKWVRTNRPHLTLEPGGSAQVLLNFKPLRRSESTPGNYPVKVKVVPQDKPEAALEVDINVRVLPYGGFGMALASERIESGEQFRLHLHNQGSGELPLTIVSDDLKNALQIDIPSAEVRLQPGQRLQIQGEVKSRKPLYVGKPREYPFDLIVKAQTPARFTAVVRGHCVEQPRFPSWMVLTAGGLLASILLLLVIGLVALLQTPPPNPQILTFEISSTQVARGTPVALYWEAEDAASFNVLLNGVPSETNLAAEEAQSQTLDIETDGLSGEITVGLEAINGEARAESVQSFYVYEPMSLEYFTVAPPQLVRNVVQAVTLDWSVPGAVKTRISGLDSFNTENIGGTTYGAQETLAGIVGIPVEAFTVTLYAEDEVGNTLEETVTVEIVNPECTSLAEDVTLRVGPGEAYQVVSTVPKDVVLDVDAQDQTGAWLRVQLAGGVSGWGPRLDFECADFFNPVDLRIALDIPPLPPTLTPTLVPTPTAMPSPTLSPTLVPTVTHVPTVVPQLETTETG